MGVVDKKARELLSDPDEFSKLANMAVFGGKPVVRPEILREADSVVALVDEDLESGSKGRKGKGSLSSRDLLMRTLIRCASASLTRSGMMNGMTHQPRAVPSAMGPVSFAYTYMNQAVPKA